MKYQPTAKNISLDANLVHAGMRGLIMPCASSMGLTPDQAFHRTEWLKKQSDAYINLVAAKVRRMEIQGEKLRARSSKPRMPKRKTARRKSI